MSEKKIHLDSRRFPVTLRYWKNVPAACAQANEAGFLIPTKWLTRKWQEVTCLSCEKSPDYRILQGIYPTLNDY